MKGVTALFLGIFGTFARAAVLSIVLMLMIRPRDTESESPLPPEGGSHKDMKTAA